MNSDLYEFMCETAQSLGYHHCTIFQSYNDTPSYWTTYHSKWQERYSQKEYNLHDWTLTSPKVPYKPSIWGYSRYKECSPIQRKIFCEAAGYEIQSGITIPIHVSKEALMMTTFAIKDTNHDQLLENKELILSVSQILNLSFSKLKEGYEISQDDIEVIKNAIIYHQNTQKKRFSDSQALRDLIWLISQECDHYAHSHLKDRLAIIFDRTLFYLKKLKGE